MTARSHRPHITAARAAVLLSALWIAGAAASLSAGARAPQASERRTVWDRVFSDEQAKRGEATYLDECSRCHMENLGGGDFGPPVVGASFWEQWNDKPLVDAFTRIRETMPQDNPGRLTAAQSADVLAFLMKANGFPAGTAALSPDAAALQSIVIVPAHK